MQYINNEAKDFPQKKIKEIKKVYQVSTRPMSSLTPLNLCPK